MVNIRLILISFALLSFMAMQHSLIWHAVEHIALQTKPSSGATIPQSKGSLSASLEKNSNNEMTCLKCLEDTAHAFALISDARLPYLLTNHVLSMADLALGDVFLSPERANQRGPPTRLV